MATKARTSTHSHTVTRPQMASGHDDLAACPQTYNGALANLAVWPCRRLLGPPPSPCRFHDTGRGHSNLADWISRSRLVSSAGYLHMSLCSMRGQCKPNILPKRSRNLKYRHTHTPQDSQLAVIYICAETAVSLRKPQRSKIHIGVQWFMRGYHVMARLGAPSHRL